MDSMFPSSSSVKTVRVPGGSPEERQSQIDQLTLELMMNKTKYRKYLEKSNSGEYEKKREGYDRFLKYKNRIRALWEDLLNDYSVSGNSPYLGNGAVQEVFDAFIEKSVDFFESREKEWFSRGSDADADADEDLFSRIDPPDSKTRERRESDACIYSAPFVNHYRPGNSFWGKNVFKRPASRDAGDDNDDADESDL